MTPFDVEHVPGSVPGRLAFGHDWTQGPLSFEGKPAVSDYYTTGYLTATGEGGKHAAYGGFTRDRPLESPNAGAGWSLLADYRTMIQWCIDAHLDGIALNLMSVAPTSPHTKRQHACLQAATEHGSFPIMLQPDMNTSLVNLSAAEMAAYLADLITKYPKAVFRLPSGEAVVSPFKAEAWTVSKWSTTLADLRKRTPAAFGPNLVNWPGKLAEFAAISAFLGVWGERVPGGAARMVAAGRESHALGKPWMAPVAVQDYRPGSQAVWEAEGFSTLGALTDAAIACDAEMILVPTLNDVSEHTNVLRSKNAGRAREVMLAYHLHRWRHGTPPPIVRPAKIVTQRPHAWNAVPTAQSKLATWRGGTPVDITETITFTPGKPLERTVTPGSYPSTPPAVQDLSYHSVLTVEDTPDYRAMYEAEREARTAAEGRAADLQVRLNEAEQTVTDYRGRLRNAHAITDIGG